MFKSINRAVARRRSVRLDGISLFLDYSREDLGQMIFLGPQSFETSHVKYHLAQAFTQALKLHHQFNDTKGAADRYDFKNQLECERHRLRSLGVSSGIKPLIKTFKREQWTAEFACQNKTRFRSASGGLI